MRNILIHTHIFKNAGTTFDNSLKKSFGDQFIDHREDDKMRAGGQAYLEEYLDANPNIVAISSHSIYFRAVNNEKFNYHQVYFLRDPLIRAHSVYEFEKKQTGVNTQGSFMAKQLGFKEFVEWYLQDSSPATIRNCQARFLAGTETEPSESDLLLAESMIRTCFLIGVVERYDESMTVFEKYLKPIFPVIDLSYTAVNVNKVFDGISIEHRIDVIKNYLREITKLFVMRNTNDYKLYLLAYECLDARLTDI